MNKYIDFDTEIGRFQTYIDNKPDVSEITVFFRTGEGKKRMDIRQTPSDLIEPDSDYFKEVLLRTIKDRFRSGDYVNATESVHD